MAKRRPRLTPKVCRGIWTIYANTEASELSYTAEGKKREELVAGLEYISDLAHWFETNKQREKEEQQRHDTFSRVLSTLAANETEKGGE